LSAQIEYICREVARLVAKHWERDPVRLARDMGVIVLYQNLGHGDSACKGFYIRKSRKHVVVINDNLSYIVKKIILAHEIGHIILKHEEMGAYHAFHLYDRTSRFEFEANLFAAELLMEDGDVIDVLKDADLFFESAARTLNVPPEMLDFKFRILKNKGLNIEALNFARSDFLKRIPGGEE
jgi:Zn-dependent peptidase ImmA (M78 family)